MSSSISLLPGVLFHGRYRVSRCIKRGGMGAVFEVFDERTSTRRALKVMHPDVVDDGDLRSRFEQEARVTGAIESDHVVRVSDAGVDDATDTPFLVMDLLRGSDLGAVLHDAGQVAPGDVVRYLGQAALGLERAHAAGIVHRDLKPENLFLTLRDDGSPCVKVLDFGIAKIIARRSQAKDTRTMGTPTYMAPEQIRGEGTIGPAADVYALGHIAYALLVGKDYWSEEASRAGSMFSFFSRVVQGMPEAPTTRAQRTRGVTLTEAFDAWLRRATATRPEDRFTGAAAAVVALAGALDVEPPPWLALALEMDPTRRDLVLDAAGATTITTAVGALASGTTMLAGDTLDTAPISVWSHTAKSVAAAAKRLDDTPEPPADEPRPQPTPAPITRSLPRWSVGLGAAAVAVAFAWGARAPLSHDRVSGAQAPDTGAAPIPSPSPSFAPPAIPSGERVAPPIAPDAGARASAEAPLPEAAKPRPQGKPRPSATGQPSEPRQPGGVL